MSAVTFEEAKTLVLARLRDAMQQIPVAERTRPRYILNFQPFSILDLIREVERGTVTGRNYVYREAKQLGFVIK